MASDARSARLNPPRKDNGDGAKLRSEDSLSLLVRNSDHSVPPAQIE